MHRYLQFSNIGHSKFSGRKLLHPEIVSLNDIEEVALDEVKKHIVLQSHQIHCVYDIKRNEGTVFIGRHNVGEFSIVEVENATTTNRP